MTRRLAAIAVVALVLLAGCNAPSLSPDVEKKTPEPTPEPRPVDLVRLSDNPGGGVHRFVDAEMGVVCYHAQNGGGDASIDCVPLPPNSTVETENP